MLLNKNEKTVSTFILSYDLPGGVLEGAGVRCGARAADGQLQTLQLRRNTGKSRDSSLPGPLGAATRDFQSSVAFSQMA